MFTIIITSLGKLFVSAVFKYVAMIFLILAVVVTVVIKFATIKHTYLNHKHTVIAYVLLFIPFMYPLSAVLAFIGMKKQKCKFTTISFYVILFLVLLPFGIQEIIDINQDLSHR